MSSIDIVGDATMTWADDRYLVVMAGSLPAHQSGLLTGVYLVEVELDGTLRTPVFDSLLLAEASTPTHPSVTLPFASGDGSMGVAIAFIDGEDVVYRRFGCP